MLKVTVEQVGQTKIQNQHKKPNKMNIHELGILRTSKEAEFSLTCTTAKNTEPAACSAATFVECSCEFLFVWAVEAFGAVWPPNSK